MKRFSISQNWMILIALLLGATLPLLQIPHLSSIAQVSSEITIKSLKLISLPLIFLSVVATLSGMESLKRLRSMGSLVFRYTIITTIIAAFVAFLLYISFGPTHQNTAQASSAGQAPSLIETILSMFPSNIALAFTENNVFGVMLIALGLGTSILVLEEEKKKILHQFFQALFTAFLKIASFLIKFLPIGVWAFCYNLVKTFLDQGAGDFKPISTYIGIVIGANLIQGLIVLPLFLLIKKIPVFQLFKSVSHALSLAFFSKSSNATLPVTMEAMNQKLGIPQKVTSFSLPLCSTINMNGCAAFIFTTVVFISWQNGVCFSLLQMLGWVVIATIAAVGNAGVPMGCFFLSSALLTGANISIESMGIILPIYALIDMIETALNVWSDCCVTAVVAKDLQRRKFSLQH